METCKLIPPHWWQWHPPVGTFIAILALLGVLVPLFRSWENIKRWEKAVWTVLMFVLLGGELRTLYLDRDEHDAEQRYAECQQLERFSHIADKIDTAIQTSQTQFTTTMQGVSTLLGKTQQAASNASQASSNASLAASKASEGIATMTGGDSWGWVMMLPFSDLPNTYFFSVNNMSKKYILRGVRLVIVDETKKGIYPMKQCDVGDIAVHTSFDAPFTPNCVQSIDPAVETHLSIIIATLNGATTEELFFHPGPNGPTMSYTVYKTLPNGERKVLNKFDPTP